jgi:predicted Zn-dependent protease
MTLTDQQKEHADLLLLTHTEYSVALQTNIAPERYARQKYEIQAKREAKEAQDDALGAAMLERAQYQPQGRGQRPDLEAEEE